MGSMARENHWAKAGNAEAKVRRMVDVAIIPCRDEDLGEIRGLAMTKFGCEVWYGTGDGREEDFLVLHSSQRKTLTDFLLMVCDEFAVPAVLVISDGSLSRVGPGFVQSQAWDGEVTTLADAYAKMQGYASFVIGGSYDTSVAARMSEAARQGNLTP